MAGKTAILSLKILGDATSAQKAAGQTKKELSGLEKAAGAAKDKMLVAGAAAGVALMKGLGDAIEADSLNNKLAAQMNLNPADQEAAGELAGSLYRDAYGESLAEVNDAISAVGSTLTTMSANGGADVERLTKKALDLAGAFDVDVAEATTAAGTMMTSGLAKDADEAMDTIVSAMQRVPAGVRDEILPSLTEYSKHYAALGMDADTVAGVMVRASEQGAIGVDKMGDALKELTIRSTDGSATSIAAYDAMGLSSEDMAGKMLAGGEDAKEGFAQIVGGLQGIEDPVAQAAAAVALFGTPLEDLGVDQIPMFLGTIDPLGDAFDSVAGSATEMGEKLNAGPGVALEEFKRNALGSLQDVAANALPYLEPLLGYLQQFAPILGPLAVALAVVAGVILTVTVATAAFNAVMALNPVTWVVLAVVALIAALVLAYNNIGWFKDAVNTAGAIASAVFGTIVSWVSTAVTWLVNVIGQSQTFQAAIDLIGAVFSLMGTLAQAAWDLVVAGVTSALDWFKSITTESETFQTVMGGLGDIAAGVFGAIDTAISKTIGWVQDAVGWFGSLFGAKNDAASVQVDGGGAGSSGGFSLAEPMLATAAVSNRMMLAADPAPMSATATATAAPAALVGTIERMGTAGRPAANRTYNVKVEFHGVTTDRIGVAREIRKLLRDEEALMGAG